MKEKIVMVMRQGRVRGVKDAMYCSADEGGPSMKRRAAEEDGREAVNVVLG